MSVRREEAYYTSAANEKRSFRTCGHNELCPYKGWFRYYENSSYTELAWFLRQRYSFYGYKARLGGNLFGMRLIFNRVTPWPSMRCERPSFTTSLIHDRQKPCGIRHNKHLRQGLQQGERRCSGVQIFYSFLFCIVFKLTYLCISHKASRTVTAALPCYVKT